MSTSFFINTSFHSLYYSLLSSTKSERISWNNFEFNIIFNIKLLENRSFASGSKDEKHRKHLALSDQTDDGMPYLLVNLTKARMKSYEYYLLFLNELLWQIKI